MQDIVQTTLNWYLLDTPCEDSIDPTLIVGGGENCGGLEKKSFLQNFDVHLYENVFEDFHIIYIMKIHFGKDILSLIV